MRNPDPLRTGALDFSSVNATPSSTKIPEIPDLESLLEASREILDGKGGHLSPEERKLLMQGTSLGGARPKATVKHDGTLFLAKFPMRDDRFDNARVERAISDLARECGIETPRTELISLPDGRGVFLSERFDRVPVPGKNGAFSRKGFFSALTLLRLDEMENGLGSYPKIADEARRIGIDCGLDLFRRMAFNLCVRNTDDHLRNHGFIREVRNWRLSPAYDLMPAMSRPGIGTFYDLSIGLGKEGRRASVKNALSECARFNLSRAEAETILGSIREKTREWRDFFAKYGVREEDMDKFSGSFQAGSEFPEA